MSLSPSLRTGTVLVALPIAAALPSRLTIAVSLLWLNLPGDGLRDSLDGRLARTR